MRKFYFLVFSLLLASSVIAQKDLHSKNKKAIQSYLKAYELDSLGNYFDTPPLLREALKRDDSFDEAYFLLFMTHMKHTNLTGAKRVFSQAEGKIEDKFKNRMLLELATLNWSKGEYSEAQRLKGLVGDEIYNVDSVAKSLVIQSIDFSIQSQGQSMAIEFDELKYPLNTYQSQYFPSITSDGTLVFTGREKGRGGANENLYSSRPTSSGWEQPQWLSDSVNTLNYNEGTASISADGLTIVFTGCNRPLGYGSCDLYESQFRNGTWSTPENLGERINTSHWESQPSLSQDGRRLYFVSTKSGGLGGQDIWMSNRVNGEWTEAVNLGSKINTRLDDCSPYLHPDGETLYFASRGRPGLGGYDIFLSSNQEGEWAEPINLGHPINTFENQVGYSLGLDGWAYYSDNNFLGETKLYRFKMPEHLLPKKELVLFKGLVKVSDSDQKLSADIWLADFLNDSTVVKTYSKRNGTFNFVPPDNEKNYMVYAQKKGYKLFKEELKKLQKVNDQYLIEMLPLAVGDRVILNNIFFDFNSATLDITAKEELQIATEFLKNNPSVQVEIGGHTDTVGDDAYNLNLSENRAKSVFDYLVSKGINPDRMTYKGYGETQPIVKTDDGEKHPENRRIELIIKKL